MTVSSMLFLYLLFFTFIFEYVHICMLYLAQVRADGDPLS